MKALLTHGLLVLLGLLSCTVTGHAATGFLKLTSTPDGVEVTVSGKRCITPCSLELPAGEHRVETRKVGFGSSTTTVTIREDQVFQRNIVLQPARSTGTDASDQIVIEQETGSLVISAETGEDVEVTWDGQSLGRTPIARKDVPVGQHEIRARGIARKFRISKGDTLRLKITRSGIVNAAQPPMPICGRNATCYINAAASPGDYWEKRAFWVKAAYLLDKNAIDGTPSEKAKIYTSGAGVIYSAIISDWTSDLQEQMGNQIVSLNDAVRFNEKAVRFDSSVTDKQSVQIVRCTHAEVLKGNLPSDAHEDCRREAGIR